jgi:arsenate reductase-like glutaredoxin family protein
MAPEPLITGVQYMNIQIYGASKCFDTKKAERYFKERGVKFQSIDVVKFGMSKGEFNNVKQAVGGLDKLLDTTSKEKDLIALMKYLSTEDQEAKLLDNPKLFKTPIVRNGKLATVGFQPDIWKNWN